MNPWSIAMDIGDRGKKPRTKCVLSVRQGLWNTFSSETGTHLVLLSAGVDRDAVSQTKSQTPHNLYYVKCAMCMDGSLQIERRACLPLSAIYDVVQIAADASSDAFTARSAVRAPVAS